MSFLDKWHLLGPKMGGRTFWVSNCGIQYLCIGASLVAKMVKNLPAMQETWVWSLGQSPWATETFSHASTVCLYLQTSSPLSIFLRFQKFKYSGMDIESQRVIIDSILGWGFQHSSNERKIIYTEHVISQLWLRGTSFY